MRANVRSRSSPIRYPPNVSTDSSTAPRGRNESTRRRIWLSALHLPARDERHPPVVTTLAKTLAWSAILRAMNEALAALAAEYHDYRSSLSPTKAHLEGDYRWADRFEEVSRASEDAEIAAERDFARRADAIPDADLSADDRITREMLSWDANTRA